MEKTDEKAIIIDFDEAPAPLMEERKEVPLEATPTETKPEEGWMDWAWGKTKDVGNTVKNTVTDPNFVDNMKDGVVLGWDKTKEGAGWVKDQVTDPAFTENVKDGVSTGWEKTKEGAGWVKDKVTDPVFQATVKEGASTAWEKTKEVTVDGYNMAKDVVEDLKK